VRTLIPISTVSPQQLDILREEMERGLIEKARGARGEVKDWVVRQLLPWTDLAIVSAGQAGALTDFWGCGAQVASTAVVYVNHLLDANEFVAIYGIAIRDTNPAVIKVLMQTGAGASTLANWNVEILYGSREPEAICPESIVWGGQETVFIQLIPDAVGKAVGADGVSDHVVLVGLICKPAGEVVSK